MLSEAEDLFKVNWFATGNKMFLRQIFRNAQGNQEFKVFVLNSDERSGDEAKQNIQSKSFL